MTENAEPQDVEDADSMQSETYNLIETYNLLVDGTQHLRQTLRSLFVFLQFACGTFVVAVSTIVVYLLVLQFKWIEPEYSVCLYPVVSVILFLPVYNFLTSCRSAVKELDDMEKRLK